MTKITKEIKPNYPRPPVAYQCSNCKHVMTPHEFEVYTHVYCPGCFNPVRNYYREIYAWKDVK
jgi:hypothetical protein